MSIVLFLVLVIASAAESMECPPADLLHPCTCQEGSFRLIDSQTLFICGGTDYYNISAIFQNVSSSQPSDQLKFTIFYLNNTAIDEISDTFFGDVQFRNVYFDNAENLSYIDPNAFNKMSSYVQYISAYRTNLTSDLLEMQEDGPFGKLDSLVELDITNNKSCPTPEQIEPCFCQLQFVDIEPFELKRLRTSITCNSTYSNLTEVFNRLSQENTTSPLYYDELLLADNDNVTELTENFFGDLRFGQIRIENLTNLQTIKPNAFGPGSSTLQFLSVSGGDFSTANKNESNNVLETFQTINNLTNLHFLYFYSTNLTFIPPRAFGQPQNKLRSVYLYGNQIKSIGSFAFAGLRSLETLSFSGNQLESVSKYAFAINEPWTNELQLNLISNPLKSDSFEVGSFVGMQRPTLLWFADASGCGWQVDYLKEAVFAPFLDHQGNRLYLAPECELICNCSMAWLSRAPQPWRNRVSLTPFSSSSHKYPGPYVPCRGGKSLFEIDEDQLVNC